VAQPTAGRPAGPLYRSVNGWRSRPQVGWPKRGLAPKARVSRLRSCPSIVQSTGWRSRALYLSVNVIVKKTPAEIERMAAAGEILVATLHMLEGKIRPGVRTQELDQAAERFIRARGATPTFKGYRGFPGSICASPNAMVVHGIPGRYRLAGGDIISIDVGVTFDGWVADAARTFPVGDIDAISENLLRYTREALYAGVAQCTVGNRVGDISHAIQKVAEGANLSVVRSLVGHGVGRNMHEDPQVPNYGRPGKGPRLEDGMVLAIEPMTTAGRPAVRMAGDNWAIFSQDDSPAAHFEFTVAITAQGPRVLTPWHLDDQQQAPDPEPLAQGAAGNG
jgi:methionyl aminopeptidase